MEVSPIPGAGQDLKDVLVVPIGQRFPSTFQNRSSLEIQLMCSDEEMPDMQSYVSAINLYVIVLFSLGGLAVLTTLILYLDTLRHVLKNANSTVKTHTAFVVSVYPVVGLATYCAIVVPRAQLLAEAVAQGMFMFSMYQLFCLFVAYCGGESELIRKVKPDSLDPRVPPCCCWPCCCLLPLLSVNKRNVMFLRMLVLQLPVVQGLVYMVLLVMWAEKQSLYRVNYMYLQLLIVASIILGIWGMIMTIKMLRDAMGGYSLPAKFFALQIVMLLSKFEGLLAKVLVWTSVLPCKPPITPSVYASLIYNSAILLEMILLSYWARSLYKKSLPEIGSHQVGVQQVCSISTISSNVEKQQESETSLPSIRRLNNNTNTFDNQNYVDIRL